MANGVRRNVLDAMVRAARRAEKETGEPVILVCMEGNSPLARELVPELAQGKLRRSVLLVATDAGWNSYTVHDAGVVTEDGEEPMPPSVNAEMVSA